MEIGICRAYDMEVEAERLVFDHCHAHGWVRGLVYVPCNNRLTRIEAGLGPDLPEWQRPALAAHLMKCPECRDPPG